MNSRLVVSGIILLQVLVQLGMAQTAELKFTLVEGPNHKPLGKINAITQDPHGYMWFAGNGESCVYRYDGNRITTFRHDEANSNSMGIDNPQTVYADTQGIIWIGGNGLDAYNPASGIFKHYRHDENDSGSLDGIVNTILEDHQDRLWVGTDRGLNLLDEKTGKFLHYRNVPGDPKSLSSNVVMAIYEDRSGVLWIGTGLPFFPPDQPNDEGGLNRLNPDGTFTRYVSDPNNSNSLVNNKVRAIFEDSKGAFWVGTSGDGLHIMVREKGSFERHIYNPEKPDALSRPPLKHGGDHITFINEDNVGAIWIGTYGAGINRFDPATKKITHYQSNNGFPDDTTWNGFISKDGVLWIATEDSNLLFRVDTFHKPVTNTSTAGAATSYVEDEEGYFWVGTFGNGVLKYDQDKKLIQHFKHDPADPFSLLDNNAVLFQNGGDTIWVRTASGVRMLDKGKQQFSWFGNGEGMKDSTGFGISKIIHDQQGFVWFGNWGKGLVRYNPEDNSIKHFLSIEHDTLTIASNFVNIIFLDQSGTLWAGGPGGLNRLDKETGRFKRYMPGNFINSLYEDSQGALWTGTENGLLRFDPEKNQFSTFLDPQLEINTSALGGIIEDNKKFLWFASQAGAVKLDPLTKEIFIYGKQFGINPGSLQLWSRSYKDRKGRLFFSHDNGFYTLSPDEVAVKTELKIIVTDFFINSLPLLPGKGRRLQIPVEEIDDVDLNYDQNNITFNFAAIDYREPEATRYFTMLENHDNKWREAVGEKSAFYFNVSPGEYLFRVKAFNRDGTKAEKTIILRISPPWWQTWWAYGFYVLCSIIAIWTFIGTRTRALKKEKIILEEKVAERTKELKEEKEIVVSTLSELKSTQAMLIQSEKMASLGELTAGIAHEIQNPLNFVNNFSEVNKELLVEMKDEITKGNLDDAKAIADDIISNQEKINHHGKRADDIVKGMLQHSRTSSGVNEPTDINALADEYFRLSYHGFRAKDKSLPAGQAGFNVLMKTDFDENIGIVKIIPQDIGRVILNVLTNAFYAVAEKSASATSSSGEKYEPTVSITTKKVGNKVEIRVRDNGNGIPQKALDKIFQPFFTTKPTGQGTGLGLSLSYDIIKAHGGTLTVETGEGEFAEFIIQLPSS